MNRKNNPWVALVALILLAAILICVCTGCGSAEAEENDIGDDRFIVERKAYKDGLYVRIMTDTETGVQYLVISHGHGTGVTVLEPGPEGEEVAHE
jgi:hypothetical protein